MNNNGMHFILVISAFFIGALPFRKWIVGGQPQNILKPSLKDVFATLLDCIKGIVLMVPVQFEWISHYESSLPVLWLMGFSATLGHCFSPWLGFQGGKGVITAFGFFVFLAPVTGAFILGVGVIAALISRMFSIASISAFIVAASIHPIFYGSNASTVFLFMTVALIVYRHEANLDKILKNCEDRF